jgi:nucleoside-diphosphate-sugar epimerase
VLFGGTGFIGKHLASHLFASGLAEQVVLADTRPLVIDAWLPELEAGCRCGRLRFVPVDVRHALPDKELPDRADLVVNLAAVHREPGHAAEEYFATNLCGAENVCAWAERVGCPWIVFSSSIAPYGPTEEEKDENSLPAPVTAYGASKLAAEKIHLAWSGADPNRRLLIVRPGVVFGPGEGGNVTRLVRAVLRHSFCYTGNRRTRKAGGYVKELCHAITWMLQRQASEKLATMLFNFTMDPPPTVEEYVQAVCREAGVKRFVPSLPYPALLAASHVVGAAGRLLHINQPVDPVRIRKLVRSNNIVPRVLRELGYPYRFTLESALADWRQQRPEDWR